MKSLRLRKVLTVITMPSSVVNSRRTLRLRRQFRLMRPDSEPGATVSQILQHNSLLKGLRRDIDTSSKDSLAPRRPP